MIEEIIIGNDNLVSIIIAEKDEVHLFTGRDFVRLILPWNTLMDLIDQFDQIKEKAGLKK